MFKGTHRWVELFRHTLMIGFPYVLLMHPIYNLERTIPNKPVMATTMMLLHPV
jgi:hypothetical protein